MKGSLQLQPHFPFYFHPLCIFSIAAINQHLKNTFGCIVVVAKEAVVDFPGVTLLLH